MSDRYTVDYDSADECWVLTDTATGTEIARDGGEPEDQMLVRDWSWVPDLLNRLDREHDEECATLRADLAHGQEVTRILVHALAAISEAAGCTYEDCDPETVCARIEKMRAGLAACERENGRLRDVLAAERGERGPEGWEWTGAWTHPSHGIVRHEFVLESGTVRVGWYIVGVDGYPRPGSYASALAAMEAADRAAKESR